MKEGVVKGGSRHPPGPRERHPPEPKGKHPPLVETATEVGGMHPTGMHSCFGK